MIKFKMFDTSKGKMDLEENVNEWLSNHRDIKVINTNLEWNEFELVYTILYTPAETK